MRFANAGNRNFLDQDMRNQYDGSHNTVRVISRVEQGNGAAIAVAKQPRAINSCINPHFI